MNKGFPIQFSTAVDVIDDVIAYAIGLKSSDIHIDPGEHNTRVRLRIDGQINQAGLIPLKLHEELIARLKILSGARTDLHAVPQDGRWTVRVDDIPYQIRISFMPSYHGENAVLRILPGKINQEISFSKLGFTPDHVRMIESALQKTSGLILVTGPTGSGKTTTLHTCLVKKSQEPLSVVTLEDPIEYEIPAVRQIHIRHNFGVTFASGLRAALRQDPDVIMVGEIRDSETAQVAIHTALTGHLVLSTLHTNSALETIPRLIDMGVDNYLLASTLKCVIAQRLVRIMCRGCHADGCEDCKGAGYIGRSVIAEVCNIDDGLKRLISRKATIQALTNYAKSRDFVPIYEDGHEKVEWGLTTREEITRVLHE